MDERISIIVPVYNVEKYIDETINRVLNQTEGNFELILVDDCSKDSSVELIKKYDDPRIRLVTQPSNMGAWAARNRGVKEATGRYICFLDSDDLWEPDKLSHELSFMKERNAGFVFTGYEFADENGVGTGAVVKVPDTINFRQALNNTTIFTSTVMIDRTIIPEKLIYMPNIESEDTATWWNILKAGNIAYGLNENLVKYRRSSNTLSSNKFKAVKRIWNLYRRVAGLSRVESCFHFVSWAFTAVLRRL